MCVGLPSSWDSALPKEGVFSFVCNSLLSYSVKRYITKSGVPFDSEFSFDCLCVYLAALGISRGTQGCSWWHVASLALEPVQVP